MCYKNKIETETELNIIDNYSIRKTRKTLRIYWGERGRADSEDNSYEYTKTEYRWKQVETIKG